MKTRLAHSREIRDFAHLMHRDCGESKDDKKVQVLFWDRTR